MKVSRNWFFTTSGDSKVSGFWQRFLGNGISKPTEATFQNLVDSTAFHTEVSSAAQTDSNAALQDKQGLVISAADVNIKSRSNVPLGATGGTLAVKPSQVTSVSAGTSDIEGDFPITQLDVTVDPAVTTRNNYLVKVTDAFRTWLISRIFKTGGTVGQVPVKGSSTNYDWNWGNEYRTTSITPWTIPTVLPDSVTIETDSPPDSLCWATGNRIRISDANNPNNYIEGKVDAYNGQIINFTADNVGGTGTINSWRVNLGGGQPSPIVVTNPQLWLSADSGNDTTGDGSISKPYKTFAKVLTILQMIADNDSTATVTVMVIGGTYNNSSNLVITTANGDAYFAYTINCFPGVIINQSTNSLYNNQTLSGHVNIYGQPNINTDGTLGVNHLFDIKARRRGANFTTTYLQLGETRIASGDASIRILSRGNGALGPSRVQLNMGFTRSFYNDYTILIDGQDNQVALKAEAITNAGNSPVCAIQIGGSGASGVTSSGFSVNIEDTLIQEDRTNSNANAIKIATLPGRDASYSGTEQNSFTAGILINRLSHYIRGSGLGSSACTFDIRGLGNGSNTVFIKDCRTMKGGTVLGSFLVGSGVGDSVCAIDNISQITPTSASTATAFGSLPTITGDSKGAYFINLFDY